jgi:hypothetical protein
VFCTSEQEKVSQKGPKTLPQVECHALSNG